MNIYVTDIPPQMCNFHGRTSTSLVEAVEGRKNKQNKRRCGEKVQLVRCVHASTGREAESERVGAAAQAGGTAEERLAAGAESLDETSG